MEPFYTSADVAAKFAQCGAALLDEHRPGWDTQVNLDQLNMANCNRCVLGQLFGIYSSGKTVLGLDSVGAQAYGFDVTYYHDMFVSYGHLKRAWTELICNRRTEKSRTEKSTMDSVVDTEARELVNA